MRPKPAISRRRPRCGLPTVAALCLVGFVAADAVRGGDEPAPAAVVGPLAEQPTLPPTVEPLDPAARQRLIAWIEAAERFRGLDLRAPLAAGVQSQQAARETLASALAEELPPSAAAPIERTLRMLGLWPQDRDLIEVVLEVLSSEVAGYYDPKKDYLALVGSVGELGEDQAAALGEAAVERMSGAIWVHEIGHALQDQHFDLERLGGAEEKLLSDRATAREALVEGDATLTMFSYVLGQPIERMPAAGKMMSELTTDASSLAAMAPEGNADVLLNAPAYLRESLVFPYFDGMAFCLAVREAGGQKLLDHAFRNDPPASSEQILHPEKWLVMRDEPVAIELPDLAPLLAGRTEVLASDLGELTLRILLSERLGEGSRDRAAEAAAGWGGDAVALYDRAGDLNDGDEVLVWISEWDDEAEAAAFLAVAVEAFGDDWRLAAEGTRVVLAAGIDAEPWGAVRAALLAAPATRSPARAVDLALLGIGEGDRPQPLGSEDLLSLMQDPAIQGMVGSQDGGDLADLMTALGEEPELMELAATIGAELTKEGAPDLESLLESIDIEAFQRSPAIQELRRKVFAAQRTKQATFVDGVVRLADTGFVMTLAENGIWVRNEPDAAAADDPDLPPVVFQGTELTTGAHAVLVEIRLPFPTMLEALVAGAQAEDLGDIEVLRRGYLETDGVRGWERELISHDAAGDTRTVQRIYLLDRDAITLLAGGPVKKWKKRAGPMIMASLEGIRFTGREGVPAAPDTETRGSQEQDEDGD